MPSIRQLQRWRRDDAEFDDRCWSSEAQGLMIQRSNLIEGMMSAIEVGGPGSSIQIQGLRELLHENGRTAGRLVARMSDRVRVSSDVKHIVIGWQEAGNLIDIKPNPINPIAVNSTDRQYVDHPKSQADQAPAKDKEDRADV
jgi:hypothetical protein